MARENEFFNRIRHTSSVTMTPAPSDLAFTRRQAGGGMPFLIGNPVPATRFRAHSSRRAVQQDLLFIPLQRGRSVDIECHLERARDMGVFNRKLPRQEYLDAILVWPEVGHTKTAAASLNDAMRVASIEYHGCSPSQRNVKACRGKVQVQPLVLAQEEIAKGRTAILGTVMVVPRAATGHQGHVTGGKYVGQSKRARPVGHCLHAALVVGPARLRSCQRHHLDVPGFQDEPRRRFPIPIRKYACRRHRHVDRA